MATWRLNPTTTLIILWISRPHCNEQTARILWMNLIWSTTEETNCWTLRPMKTWSIDSKQPLRRFTLDWHQERRPLQWRTEVEDQRTSTMLLTTTSHTLLTQLKCLTRERFLARATTRQWDCLQISTELLPENFTLTQWSMLSTKIHHLSDLARWTCSTQKARKTCKLTFRAKRLQEKLIATTRDLLTKSRQFSMMREAGEKSETSTCKQRLKLSKESSKNLWQTWS